MTRFFSAKKALTFFLLLYENIHGGYSLEVPRIRMLLLSTNTLIYHGEIMISTIIVLRTSRTIRPEQTVTIWIRCCSMQYLIRVNTVWHLSGNFKKIDIQIFGQVWQELKVFAYLE